MAVCHLVGELEFVGVLSDIGFYGHGLLGMMPIILLLGLQGCKVEDFVSLFVEHQFKMCFVHF